MVSSFGEVPEVKQNVDVQDCLRQGVFSRSWSTIQHWLPEIGEFSVHAIGLSTIEAQFEVLFFQFVCGLALIATSAQSPAGSWVPSVTSRKLDTKCWSNAAGQAASLEKTNK